MELTDLGDWGVNGDISANEARWASEQLLGPLNQAVRQAAMTHGWTLVGGIADQFRPHGYCAMETLIVQALETKFGQLNEDGVLHPNRHGHQFYADGLTAAVRERLGV